MQAVLQYFPCLTNPVTAALEGCGRQLEEHLKPASGFYWLYEHTRKSYAQQIPDHSFQGQYSNPRTILPSKLLLALNISFVLLCVWVSLTCLKTLQQGEIISVRGPGFRDTPGTELNLPGDRLAPAKTQALAEGWCLGRSANSFLLDSVFPSARHIKWANPTTA